MASTILAQWLDPRHSQLEVNRQLFELTLQVDSLAEEVREKDRFIANFQQIVEGNVPDGSADSMYLSQEEMQDFNKDVEITSLAAIDSQFRKELENENFTMTAVNRSGAGILQEGFFFSPISGIVSSAFNGKIGHFGIDVVAKSNEPVKSVMDGTVIFSSWTQDGGNVIAVQHRNNLVSVYKHNSALLKKAGNFVNAGEIISVIGNTGELTTGPHLHFELWYNGNPVDPEEFVSF
ncbi:M23 family metallopeptidase [Roseivirga sp. BDSF3-8]|uniref:M23 family metallopeptidase n=1 Tax=Roseivirga sp. BDSF3-8 TaxID=3241598 RepID=UPI0035323320